MTIKAGIIPITPVDVTPRWTWRIQNVDCSPYVPVGTQGVLLDIASTVVNSQNQYTVRKKGSTDMFIGRLGNYCHTLVAIGVDDNRKFQAAINEYRIRERYIGN